MKFKSWKQRAEDRGTSVSTEKRIAATDSRYPKLVQMTPGRVAFVASECDAYDAILIAERDEGQQADQTARAARRAGGGDAGAA